ncbi:Uncharacterised protein [Bordetella pertussis]|nr:Uncharacterised protein [Bordetella pertussis]CFP62873.1 Uncharacterised protein [Bordetella pertussis]CFW51411.1 Uncharacterised protein [Bordetella pertussis]
MDSMGISAARPASINLIILSPLISYLNLHNQ